MTPARSGDIRLRAAVPSDAAAIGQVFDAAVLKEWDYFENIESMVPMFDQAHWEDLVADLADPDLLLVATMDTQVVGFVATRAHEGELYLLFVHPDSAGHGIGRQLLDAAHQSLRGHGHREVFLYTHEANRRAREVYEAAGYRHDGGYREEPFRGQLQREMRLRAALDAGQ